MANTKWLMPISYERLLSAKLCLSLGKAHWLLQAESGRNSISMPNK